MEQALGFNRHRRSDEDPASHRTARRRPTAPQEIVRRAGAWALLLLAAASLAQATPPDRDDPSRGGRPASFPDLSDPVIELIDENGGELERGDTLTCRYEVTNRGDAEATGVRFTAPLPGSHRAYVEGSTRVDGEPVPDERGRSPLLSQLPVRAPGSPPGVVPPGETAVATARVRVGDNTPCRAGMPFTFSVTSDTGHGGSVTILRRITCAPPAPPGDSEPAATLIPNAGDFGRPVSYLLRLIHAPDAQETIVRVSMEPAGGFTNVHGVSAPAGWSVGVIGGRVVWEAGPGAGLAPGETTDFQWGATCPGVVGAGGPYEHRWEAASASGPTWGGPLPFHVREPDLSDVRLTLTDENGGWLHRGDRVTYRMAAVNGGDMVAIGVRCQAPVPPPYTEYVPGTTRLGGVAVPDAGAESPVAGGLLVQSAGMSPGVIAPGDSAVVTVQVRVRDDAPPAGDGGRLDLRLTVTSQTGHGGDDRRIGPDIVGASLAVALRGPAKGVICQPAEYEVELTAGGPAPTLDAWCAVDIPEAFTYVAGTTRIVATGSGYGLASDPHVSGGRLLFNHDGAGPNPDDDPLWDIAPGERVTITFALDPRTCAPGSYGLTATAHGRDVGAGDEDEGAGHEDAGHEDVGDALATATLTTRLPQTLLTLVPSASVPVARVGDVVTWNLRLSASGEGDVAGISLVDELGPGLGFDPGGTQPAPTRIEPIRGGGTRLVWDASVGALAHLPSGRSRTVVLSAELTDCEGLDAVATATWGCDGADPCQRVAVPHPIAGDCPAHPHCDIDFERTVNGARQVTVDPREQIVYEAVIDLSRVSTYLSWDFLRFESEAPEGQTFLGYLDAADNLVPGKMAVTFERGGRRCAFDVEPQQDGAGHLALDFSGLARSASLASCAARPRWRVPGGSLIKLRYAMTAPGSAGVFSDVGRLVVTDGACSGQSRAPVEIRVQGAPMIASLDLQAAPTTATVRPGGELTCLVTLNNTGSALLTDVRIEAALPPGLSYTGFNGDEEIAERSASPPVHEIARLPVATSKLLTLHFAATSRPADLSNPVRLMLTAAGDDPTGHAVTAQPTETVVPVQVPGTGLDIYKTARPGLALPGERVAYEVTVTNTGDQPLYNVDVADEVPAGLTLAGAQLAPGVAYLTAPPLTYRVADLAPGAARSFVLDFAVASDPNALDERVVNTLSATARDAAGNPVLAEPFTLSLPRGDALVGLDVQMVATRATLVPGEEVTYLVTLTNTGAEPLSGLVLTCASPSPLTPRGAAHDGDIQHTSSQPPTFEVSTLPPHTSKVIALSFDSDPDGGLYPDILVSTAQATATAPGGLDVTDEPATTALPVVPRGASLQLSKVNAHAAHVVMGRQTTYTITISNGGDQDLTDITIYDLPSHRLDFAYAQLGNDVEQIQQQPPVLHLDELPVHAEKTIALTFDVLFDPEAGEIFVTNGVWATARDEAGELFATDTTATRLPVLRPSATLQVDKVATSGAVTPGGTVTYLITAQNAGEMTLSDVTLTDILPAGLAFALADPDPGMVQTSPDPPTFVVPTLPPGAAATVALTCAADPNPAVFAPEVINIAEGFATDEGEQPVIAEPDSAVLPLRLPARDLDLQKAAATDRVVPGEPLTYLITVANTGAQDLSDVEVIDEAPPGLAFTKAEHDDSVLLESTTPPTLRIPTLAAGDHELIALVFEADADPTSIVDPAVNRATARGWALGEVEVVAVPDTSVLPVLPDSGAIDIEKTAVESPFTAGGLGHYLITVTNTGPVDLAEVTAHDLLPAGLTYIDAEPPATETAPGMLTWTLPDLRPGRSHTIVLSVGVDYALHGESVTNTADVSGATPDARVVTDVDAVTTPCRAEDSSIHVEKLANETRLVMGGQVSYHLLVANDGGLPLDSLIVRDSIPDGLSYVNADFDPQMFTLVTTDPVVELQLIEGQELLPTSEEAITLFFNAARDYALYNLPPMDSTVVNRIKVVARDPKGDLVADADEAELELISPRAAIQVHYAHTTGQIVPDERATYLATIENIGDQALSEVALRIPDLAPQGLDYETSNFDSSAVATAHGGGFHRWQLTGALAAGAAEQIRITYHARREILSLVPAGVVASAATVTALDEAGESLGDDGEESVPLSPKRGALTLDNTAAQGEITPGETVTYVLTVAAGPELELVDLAVSAQNLGGQGLTLLQTSYDEAVFEETAALQWTARDTFPAGWQEEIRVTYQANEDAQRLPLHVTMLAEAFADDAYGRPLSDSDEEMLPVLLPQSHLLLEKTALASAVVPGESVTFLLTATNNGNQDLADLRIADHLPVQLAPAAWYVESNDVLYDDSNPRQPVWTLTTPLPKGEAITIRFVAASDPDPTIYGETLTNEARATATDEGGGQLEARASDVLPVHTPDVAVEATKIPQQNVVVPGGSLGYTLIVTNVGRTELTATTVTEEIPAGLTYVSSSFDAGEVTLIDTDPDLVWDVASLQPGRSVSIQVFFAADADPARLTNPLVNQVTVEAAGPGDQQVTDLASASLPVQDQAPSLYVEKRAASSVARPGERIEYEITLTNNGDQTLSDVAVTDALEPGLTYEGSRFDETMIGLWSTAPTIEWRVLEPLAPGGRHSIHLTVVAHGDIDSLANPVTNTVQATGIAPGEVLVADEATESLPLQQAGPRVTIQVFTGAPVVWPGQEILYTVQITNTGNRDIVKAVLRDDLPQGLAFVSSVFDPNVLSYGGNAIDPVWNVARLPIGATETVTVRLRADSDARGLDDPVVNVGVIEAWDAYGGYFEDSDFEETPLADLEPALNLDVLATTGAIVPGEQITYLVDLTNTGDEDLYEVAVTDTLPAGLSIFSTDYDPIHVVEERSTVSLANGADEDREVITWTMQVLPTAAIERMRLTCSVTENAAALDSVVTHTFHAHAVNAGQAAIADSDGDALAVVAPGAAVGIDKTALRGDIVPGDRISYLLTVRNAGEAKLEQVRVADRIPAGFTFDQTSFDNTVATFAGADADSAVWTLAELAVGGYEQLRVTYLVGSDVLGASGADTLTTTADVRALDPSGEPVADSDAETLPIHPRRSGIQLLKWADATAGLAIQGAEIAYHIQVVNTGEQDLAPVTVIDYLPGGLRYLEADVAPDSVVVDADETRVYWSRDILHRVESWEVLIRARIDTLLIDGAVVQNRATAIGIDERDEEVRSSDVSRVLAGLPDMQIEKTVDRPTARPGDKLTYTITYRNSGTADAQNVVVMDALPDHVTYVSGSATGGAVYEPRFNAVTRTRDELEIDQGAIFSYQVVLDPEIPLGTSIPNTAEVYADGLSPALSDTAWVLVTDKAIELVKTVDRSVATVGDTLSYTLTYQNLSDQDFAAATITDQVPSELDHVYTGSGNEGTYDPGLRRVTWEIGPIGAGEVGQVPMRGVVRPDAVVTGSVVNEAVILADSLAVPSNRVVTLVVEDVGVALAKRVDRAVAVPGDLLTYTLVVRNIGPAPLTAVTVTDPVPPELDYEPPEAGEITGEPLPEHDPALGTLTWRVSVIAPEQSVTLSFRGRVRADVASGRMISNTATVETHETEPVVSNPAHTLVQYPELSIVKRPDRSPIVVGEEVTYTVVVANLADGTTDSTWVTDLLPRGFDYVAGSSVLRSGGDILSQRDPRSGEAPGTGAGASWVWDLGRLGAYEADTLSYRARVTGDAGPGLHDNHATVCGITPMGSEVCTDPAVATVEVVVPSLTLTKTTAERAVEIGDVVLYHLTIQNNAAAPVIDLEVRDHLPVGFQVLPGSCVMNGAAASDPVVHGRGLPGSASSGPAGTRAGRNVAIWTVPELAGGGELELSYVAVVGLNAGGGVAINVAEAVGVDQGGGRVVAGPAEARVFVLDDELPSRLRGRVIVDCDGDGRPDAPQGRSLRLSASGRLVDERGDLVTGLEDGEPLPYEGIEILIEDGRRVRTDARGEFFFYPLQWGDHAVYLDPRSLAPGARVIGRDSEFFTVLEGGEARIEFRICPPPPKQGSIQLVKAVDPPEIMAIKRVLEPEVYLVEGILFDSGTATLRPEAGRVLAEAAARLIEDPTATASIEGHTDNRPIRTTRFADNVALSEARARVVRDALCSRYDLDPERFTVRGFGPDRPVAPNTTARNQSLNRRTEIIILPSLDSLTTAALFDPAEVTFTLRVVYEGNFPPGEGLLREAVVRDAVPYGLEYLLGSTRVNGQPADDPEIVLAHRSDEAQDGRRREGSAPEDDLERLLEWPLGALRPGDALEIAYRGVITDVPRPGRSNTYDDGSVRSGGSAAEHAGRHVAEVDSLLRDPVFRNGRHLWENRAWFHGLRDGGEPVRTPAGGADLKLSFERTLAPVKITVEDVLFETARAVLRSEAFGILDPAADIIRSRPGCRVRIEGHTDIRPIRTPEFPSNQELSEARAQAVRDYFVQIEQLDPAIFHVRGFGPRRPVADNETAAGRQKNRRVEIIITSEEAHDESFRPVVPGRYPPAVKVDLR